MELRSTPQFNCWPPMFPRINATSEKITDYTKTPQSEGSNVKYFFSAIGIEVATYARAMVQ
jgi:hypothetical protein